MSDTKDNDLVFVEKAASPVVLSVPHDGYQAGHFKNMYAVRKKGSKDRDLRTWQLVRDINHPTEASDPVCSIVHGYMSRDIIDYNRSPSEDDDTHAYTDKKVKHFYSRYHEEIEGLIFNALRHFGCAVLLDIHGFASREDDYDIILGTQHRQTCKVYGFDITLAKYLREAGYSVYLPEEYSVKGERYSGRYTIERHSSCKNDAIQVEVSPKFRQKAKSYDSEEALKRRELAGTLRDFIKEYTREKCGKA